jgi:hypothetical protein
MQNTLKSYLFWTYPRGSFHYDVMVTLILAFIFISPRLINYRERPQETLTSASGVLVKASGKNAFTYEIGAGLVKEAANDADLKAELLTRIQTISGNVQLDRYTAQKDASGHVFEYRVWAHR